MGTTQPKNIVSSQSESILLRANDLSVQILDSKIIHSIQLSLYPSTITGLVGPNGCGKTTLLRSICGYLTYSGTILLEEKEIRNWPRKKLTRKIAFVQQAPSLSFDFTVEELVLLGLLPSKALLEGISTEDRISMNTALQKVGLTGYASRIIQSLSGGERQRVFLAQAILQDSNLLLLDEPTSHLDVCHQYQFMGLMKELVDSGKTILAVFHDLELAARFSDQLLVLNHGHIVDAGTPKAVLTKELLAEVFHMRANVDMTSSGENKIHYESPLPI